jgi:hypothetical protein
MLLRQETTCKNDVWALGITLCELVAAKLLWAHGDNEAEVRDPASLVNKR